MERTGRHHQRHVELRLGPTARLAQLQQFWTDPRQMNVAITTHHVIEAVKRRLDDEGVEMPAEIVAKTVLLARDEKITDPTILAQLGY